MLYGIGAFLCYNYCKKSSARFLITIKVAKVCGGRWKNRLKGIKD